MKKPETLTDWDFTDRVTRLCGFDLESVPDLTRENFNKLIEEHNNLVEVLNMLCDKLQITIDD